MKNARLINISSKAFVGFCILSLGYVSFLSIISPQVTMNLVQVTLPNNDAISSIRGIYGGVGLAIVLSLVYLMWKDLPKALSFLVIFWGAYALSRIITIAVDGALGDFGTQWLMIESLCFVCAIGLWGLNKRSLRHERN